jgi:uracil-DNA glycosylase family 4
MPRAAPGHRTLAEVGRAVVACERCPRLRAWCRRVAQEKVARFKGWEYWGRPVPGLGDPGARLFVVGLAPAAHGGNRTGRMFTGDASGDWLYGALHRHGFASQPHSISREDGLTLRDCYIAAAARCAPPGNKPTPREFANCRPYLEAELRLLPRVRVVVALGRLAHDSLLHAMGRPSGRAAPVRPRFGHRAEAVLPGGVVLLDSYHPSRRNTSTGLLTPPMWNDVWRRARELVEAPPRG